MEIIKMDNNTQLHIGGFSLYNFGMETINFYSGIILYHRNGYIRSILIQYDLIPVRYEYSSLFKRLYQYETPFLPGHFCFCL